MAKKLFRYRRDKRLHKKISYKINYTIININCKLHARLLTSKRLTSTYKVILKFLLHYRHCVACVKSLC